MPRPKSEYKRGIYPNLVDAASQQDTAEKNDCAVKAVAVVCNVAYDEAWTALNKLGRKTGKGTPREMTRKAIEDFGFKIELVDLESVKATYPKPHSGLKNITTHHHERFPEAWGTERKLNNTLLFSKGHVSAFKDGVLHDWSVGRKLHVWQMWHIVPADGTPSDVIVDLKRLADVHHALTPKRLDALKSTTEDGGLLSRHMGDTLIKYEWAERVNDSDGKPMRVDGAAKDEWLFKITKAGEKILRKEAAQEICEQL